MGPAITSRHVVWNAATGKSSWAGLDEAKLISEVSSRARDGGVMHKTTPTDVALDQPFGFENFIGGRNGRPVQSKLASQFSRRREPIIHQTGSRYESDLQS